MEVCWPYFDPVFKNLVDKYHGPRVCIDNESLEDCTVVTIDSAKKQGLLLEVVQTLTEMDLVISKGYISSEGQWLMDVFHVKDQLGHKLTDKKLIDYIERSIIELGKSPKTGEITTCLGNAVGSGPTSDQTTIEITAKDRPGLLSEIFAVLNELRCNVVATHLWTHNARLACIVYVTDQSASGRIEDPDRLADIHGHLSKVLKVSEDQQPGSMCASTEFNNQIDCADRRLHQLMLSDRDFEESRSKCTSTTSISEHDSNQPAENRRDITIDIEGCKEKRYSVISVRSKDRPKLMFDTVCTLTDMQYLVFHATVASQESLAFQEYYIRRMDGSTLETESEKQRVAKCLEAAIERRVCEGIRVELRTHKQTHSLSEAARLLRENGLSVVRADTSTQRGKSVNVFYVRDVSGNEVDMKAVESIRRGMGPCVMQVKDVHLQSSSPPRPRFSIGGIIRSHLERISHDFISIS